MARPDWAWTAGAAALICTAAVGLSAHRRDEHLQAARIGIELERVDVELDITPGADVADALVSAIDGDHDGQLSETERDAYAQRAIAGLALTIDGRGHALHLASATFPEVTGMRRGEGTIRLHSRAAISAQDSGAHQLRFVNAIALARSAYLANALVPDSPRLLITAQHRSVDQRDVTIDYTVATNGRVWAAPLAWSVAAGMVMLPLGFRLLRARDRSARA